MLVQDGCCESVILQGTERKKRLSRSQVPIPAASDDLTVDFKPCCIFSKHGYHVLDSVPKLGEIKSKARSLPSFLQHQRKDVQDPETCPNYILLELILK